MRVKDRLLVGGLVVLSSIIVAQFAALESGKPHKPVVNFAPFVSEAQAADEEPPLKYATGYKPPTEAVRARTIKATGYVTFPKVSAASWDCRTLGIVPGVRDQGNCGSCWDFAGSSTVTCALIKGNYLKLADDPRCSEQYVLDCGRNGGCNGDDHSSVFDMAKAKGLPLQSEYGPYQARSNRCKDTSAMKFYTISAWGYCDPGARGAADTQKIKDAMVQYGPISVAIAANNAFSNVKPGEVFKGNASGINHEVMLVGWDDSKGAWILRNSWGSGWCDKGYCWIAYGANGVGTDAAWVSVTALPPPEPGPGPQPPPVPGTAPAITSPLTAAASVGAAFTYQIAATNSPTAFAASGLPAGLSVATATGLISGTPTATGAFSIGLIAANSSGAGTATLTLSVGTGPAPQPGTVNVQLSPDVARNIMVQIANQTGGVLVTPDMTLQEVIDAMAKVKKGEAQPQCCGGIEKPPADDSRVKATEAEIAALKRGMVAILDRLDAMKAKK